MDAVEGRTVALRGAAAREYYRANNNDRGRTMEEVINYLARWGHMLAGITWIGLLYYFNFVQTEYFKEAEDNARVDAFTKLAPRALWWFRWAAALTFLTGLILLYFIMRGVSVDIVLGAVMGTLMFLNVWLIIWPNQKIVIASNEQIKGGGEALSEAAAGRAEGSTGVAHQYALVAAHVVPDGVALAFWVWPVQRPRARPFRGSHHHRGVGTQCHLRQAGSITTVRGVIISSLVLTAVFWGVVKVL